MSKLFILLLVALGVALYFPDSRAWLSERARPVVNPILRTATVSEMDKIVGDLNTHARENLGVYPEARGFQAWLDATYAGDGGLDSWGNAYELQDLRRDRRMQIRSWGPDRVRATEDDIIVEFRREGR